jgi:hypothetical protein
VNHGLLNAEELKTWILRRLGSPALNVPLEDGHLEDAIDSAARWFAARKGVKKSAYIDVYAGQVEYALDEDVNTVLDVAFAVPALDIGSVFAPFLLPDQQIPYNVFSAPQSAGIYSNYVQTLGYIEQAKRILGSEMEWRQEDRTLFIFPAQKNQGKARIEYTSHDFTIEQLNERDHDLLKRYALAQAKYDLGTILRRYPGGFPSAQGTTQLDGAQLLEEAKKEIEDLTEEIAQSGFPLGFLSG